MQKSSLIAICVLLVVGLGAGCSRSKSSYDYLTQARQDQLNGNDQAALIDLKNALQKDPKNGEARYLLAMMLIKNGEGASAEIELRQAINIGINRSYVAPAMGQALLLQRQYQKVLDDVKVADGDKGKVAADIYSVRGEAYLGLGNSSEAKASFEQALKEYPDSADAYLGMGQLAAMKNDLNEALHQADIALSKDPNSIKSWLMKANILRIQGKGEDARSTYNHIIQADKTNVAAYLGLASMDMAANKLDVAKAEIDAALKSSPKALAARYALALVEFQRGMFQDAQESVQAVLKVAPDHLPSVLLHGAIAFTQGSYEQARSDLNRVLAQYPNNAYARRLLAAVQLKTGETGPAMETLKPLLTVDNADAQALALAGEAQLQLRNFTKATEYLQKAIELNPHEERLQTQLAISRLGTGDVEQAIGELAEVAKQVPGQSPAGIIVVLAYIQRKEYDQALSAILSLEKKLGPNPIVYNLRGNALLGKQDFAGARKAFEQALAIQPTDFSDAANLALLDLRDKKPDLARGRFNAILEKDKTNVQAMLALAELELSQKREHEYVGWLEKAKEAQPNSILPHIRLADYYLAKKDKAKALEVANAAFNAHPDSPEALHLLGATQLAVGDKEDALNTFTKLVNMAPSVSAYYLQLALIQTEVKKMTEARASLNKALALQPDFLQARDALMRLDLAENNGDDALKIARQMETQQTKSPAGYDREADILLARKQYAQAVKAYEQALVRGAGSAGLIKLHRALTIAGDGRAAEQRLTSWINQNPKDVVVRAYAAEYYMANNRNRDAVVQYEELLKLASQNPQALNNLANLYQREKDSRALVTAEQGLKLAPENPIMQDTLGWILVEQGQLPRALKLLRAAVTNAPKMGFMHYHLAVALARSGQKVEAKKELEAAIGTGQKFSELNDAKAMLKGL